MIIVVRPVPGERLVRHKLCGHTVGRDFGCGLAERKCLGLGEQIGDEGVVVIDRRKVGFEEADQVRGHRCGPLVDQLVERVLSVRPRFTPDDCPGVVSNAPTVERDTFAVALHVELLQVRGEPLEQLAVGEHGVGRPLPEVAIPDADECE